jgi:hypothetical protein
MKLLKRISKAHKEPKYTSMNKAMDEKIQPVKL